jgi:hypothetical protein
VVRSPSPTAAAVDQLALAALAGDALAERWTLDG